MIKKKWAIIALLSLLVMGCAMMGTIMSNVEQPEYRVISSVDNIETRRYAPMIIAEVEVDGKREEAIQAGFRMLADYIFGNNTVKQDIVMTAPVQQQVNEKIAMTAPVQQQATNDAWKVSFVMPSTYSMESLPKPNSDKVTIKEVAEKEFIVIRFSGLHSARNLAEQEKLLLKYVTENKIKTVGAPKYAFYNPPWTLPFLRRNEIMIEINSK